MRTTSLLSVLLFVALAAPAAPPVITKHIKVDQFGYLPNSRKVAVIVDPQTGYNAAESFSPGTGTNQYQLRRWSDDAVVFSGTITSWNGGATQAQSGDRGWWFDFSAVTAPGSYYIYDLTNNAGSYRFDIGNTVYDDVLKHAVRMFFYQRINYPKQTPYTDAKWADAACFEGANQDRFARSRYDKANPATAKDLHGGWMDAGDYNKYVTFTFQPLCNMMEAYRLFPAAFKDNYNIPESGNGTPDLLDEIKWELDWLKRMQDATGTDGLLLKVGADVYTAYSPASTDVNPRYYVPECTSSTLTGAATFALGALVYKSLPDPAMKSYGDDLLARAQRAWTRANVTTAGFTSFSTTCDDQDIKSGDADVTIQDQREMAITAATYLYEATGNTAYRTVFDNLYSMARPYANWWWGPYYTAVERALLRYSTMPGATATVASNISSMKSGQNGVLSINDYSAGTDLYRSHMPDDQYHWGSHEVKANAGVHNLDFISFGINSTQHTLYKEAAEAYLHWFHGVNPMGKVMLSNMYAYGGDDCVNEIYHSWFGDGTNWDNVLTSPYGPAPGYIPVGPNKFFPVSTISPPYGQPAQKSYKEWNTAWNGSYNENSWEITEPTIYSQGAYVSLLGRLIGQNNLLTLPLHILDITATATQAGATVRWNIESNNEIDWFEVERSTNGIDYALVTKTVFVNGTGQYSIDDNAIGNAGGKIYYRVKQVDKNGAVYYSKTVVVHRSQTASFSIQPNPAGQWAQLTGNLPGKGLMIVQLNDANGNQVMTYQWQQDIGNFRKPLDVSQLPAGLYWVTIQYDNNRQVLKLTKL